MRIIKTTGHTVIDYEIDFYSDEITRVHIDETQFAVGELESLMALFEKKLQCLYKQVCFYSSKVLLSFDRKTQHKCEQGFLLRKD